MCLSRIGQIVYGGLALITAALTVASVFTPGWNQLTTTVLNSLNNGQMPLLNMGLFQYACQTPNQNGLQQYGAQPFVQNQYGTGQLSGMQSQIPTASYGQYGTSQNLYPQYQGQMTQYPQQQTSQGQFSQSQYGNVGVGTPIWTGNPLDYCFQWWQNQPNWQKIVIVAMIVGLLAAIASFLWNLTTFCVCCFKGTIQKPLPALSGISAIAIIIGVALFWYNNQTMIQNIQLNQYANMVVGNTPTTSNVNYSFWMACGAAAAAIANVVVGTLIVCLSESCL